MISARSKIILLAQIIKTCMRIIHINKKGFKMKTFSYVIRLKDVLSCIKLLQQLNLFLVFGYQISKSYQLCLEK